MDALGAKYRPKMEALQKQMQALQAQAQAEAQPIMAQMQAETKPVATKMNAEIEAVFTPAQRAKMKQWKDQAAAQQKMMGGMGMAGGQP